MRDRLVDVHQHVVRDDGVEARVGERQRPGVGEHVLGFRIGLAGEIDQGRREVDARNAVTEAAQVAADAALAASYVECCLSRQRNDELEERVAHELVRIVAGLACPRRPVVRLLLPEVREAHRFTARMCSAIGSCGRLVPGTSRSASITRPARASAAAYRSSGWCQFSISPSPNGRRRLRDSR